MTRESNEDLPLDLISLPPSSESESTTAQVTPENQIDYSLSQAAEARHILQLEKLTLSLPSPSQNDHPPSGLKRILIDNCSYKRSKHSGRLIIPPLDHWKHERLERAGGRTVAVYKDSQDVKDKPPLYNDERVMQKATWKPNDCGEVFLKSDQQGEVKIVTIKAKSDLQTFRVDGEVEGIVLMSRRKCVHVKINTEEFLLSQYDCFKVLKGEEFTIGNLSDASIARVSLIIFNQ